MEPNPQFSHVASIEQVERARVALIANGIETIVVPDGAAAQAEVLSRIPAGSQVFTMQSVTLKSTGITELIDESGKYDSIRKAFMAMGPAPSKEKRVLGATPDWAVGSVHAVTEDGHLFIASNTGSQLAAYVSGASHVVFVVGTQKIVSDDPTALKRLWEYSMPLEDQRLFELRQFHSSIKKILTIYGEHAKGRMTVILVQEKLGF